MTKVVESVETEWEKTKQKGGTTTWVDCCCCVMWARFCSQVYKEEKYLNKDWERRAVKFSYQSEESEDNKK